MNSRPTQPSRKAGRFLATALAALLLSGGVANAQDREDRRESQIEAADGRTRGYDRMSATVLDGSGAGLTYMAFIGMTVLAVSVMFKSARRTHLD